MPSEAAYRGIEWWWQEASKIWCWHGAICDSCRLTGN